MSTSTEGRSGRDTGPRAPMILSRWLVLCYLFPLVYILSTGPAIKLCQLGVVPRQAVAIYTPLALLCQHSRPAARILDWYVLRVWHVQ